VDCHCQQDVKNRMKVSLPTWENGKRKYFMQKEHLNQNILITHIQWDLMGKMDISNPFSRHVASTTFPPFLIFFTS